MSSERFFMDSAFVLAMLNPKDAFHDSALELLPRVRVARAIWLHDGIVLEVANGLSQKQRESAVDFIEKVYRTTNTKVIPLDRKLMKRAVQLYRERSDKEWGLTDCVSFVLMNDHSLEEALTSDHHFEQAGFKILLKA